MATKTDQPPAEWERITPEVVDRLDRESDVAGTNATYYWLADAKHGCVRWGCFSYREEDRYYFNDGNAYFEGITHIMAFTPPELPKD